MTGPASYFPSIEKKYEKPIEHWMKELKRVSTHVTSGGSGAAGLSVPFFIPFAMIAYSSKTPISEEGDALVSNSSLVPLFVWPVALL